MIYRIAIVEWQTAFGEMRRTPPVQMRVGFFWWVTVTHCETVSQCKTYIRNVSKKKQDRLIQVVNWKHE